MTHRRIRLSSLVADDRDARGATRGSIPGDLAAFPPPPWSSPDWTDAGICARPKCVETGTVAQHNALDQYHGPEMNHTNGKTAILAAALALVCLVTLSAAVFMIDGRPMPLRLGLTAVAWLLAGSAGWLTLSWVKSDRLAVARHLDAVCGLDTADLQHGEGLDNVPPLPKSSPWSAVAARVRQTLVEQGRRLEDLQHSQTALEIRSRRAAGQSHQIKAILAGLSDPVIAVDDFEELVLANPAAEELFNFSADDTEKGAVAQLVHCQALIDLLGETCRRQTSSTRTDEIEIVGADGESGWYRASATRLPATGGDESTGRQGAVAVLRDIGRQKALAKRNAEFVSAVSHEMKSPLAGIKAYVELLVDGDAEDEETQEEFLEVINSQADRLQRLVDNMLNLARIEAGVVSVNKESRSLNEILEEAAGVVQPAADAKQIELATELSQLYLGVLADRDMLLQSAINLLSNAVKYTPDGGRVTLRSRLVDEQVVFEVQDTGVGLSAEDCQRVFDKFYRVAKDKTMAPGTGLGLPLAKHIVEDVHGGTLDVTSTLGTGSTFVVTLPKAGQRT